MGSKIAILDRLAPQGTQPPQLFESIAFAVKEVRGISIDHPGPNTILIAQKTRPLLPLNPLSWLLWLLTARKSTVTISTEERDGCLLVTAVGEGNRHFVRALERFLATYDESRLRADLDGSWFLTNHDHQES